MNPKKYLKKAARAERKKILENGEGLLASLEAKMPVLRDADEAASLDADETRKAHVEDAALDAGMPAEVEKPQDEDVVKKIENGIELQTAKVKKKRRRAVWLSAAASAVAAVFVICAVCVGVFAFREKDVVYHERDIVFETSDLAEMDGFCREFALDLTDCELSFVSKAFDSVSGDVLYFETGLRAGNEIEVRLIRVCNPKYEFVGHAPALSRSQEFDGFTLFYELYTSLKNGCFETEAWGKIEGTQERVFITFSQLAERNENAFLPLISQIIKKP